ncbi:MAG: hypothetical protein R3251_01790 [Candidatus Spechtbacterales bacterium]|nr:hypothetical protein [Candidatus Spechtbacterales bacterium]
MPVMLVNSKRKEKFVKAGKIFIVIFTTLGFILFLVAPLLGGGSYF